MHAEVTTHVGRKTLDRPSKDQVFQSLLNRTRTALDLDQVKAICGFRMRPCRRKLRQARYGVVVETPTYDLTVFKVHFGKLTPKIYADGLSNSPLR